MRLCDWQMETAKVLGANKDDRAAGPADNPSKGQRSQREFKMLPQTYMQNKWDKTASLIQAERKQDI